MKKLFLLALAASLGSSVAAQPWMPSPGAKPYKFSEIVELNPLSSIQDDEEERHSADGKEKGEGKNHLYQKWFWYWEQHLDDQGYMISPQKTLEEWQKYIAQADQIKAQSRTTAAGASWEFQGPFTCNGGYSGLGRINTIEFDPIDSLTFYVGSAGGGTWKTTDGGVTWASLYDNLPTLGVADIEINPRNPNTIYIATGDGDAGDAFSSGVIVSHNGGTSWSTTGVNWIPTNYLAARSLLINPVDTNTLLLASNNGLYKTHNAGATWTIMNTSNFKQILYNPIDTHLVYASIYTDTSAQIMRSRNGGRTWSRVTTFADAQRIALAVCPANPAIVRALVSNKMSGFMGVYTSTDSGATYVATYIDDTFCLNNMLGYDLGLPTAHCNGQGWYDLCIAMDPRYPQRITIGGVNTYQSYNGGLNWQLANQWWTGKPDVATVHADKHCLAYNKLSNALFETCDGGVYKSYQPTGAWMDISNGVHVTEFYRNAVDNLVPVCIGGAQDNGTKSIYDFTSADLTGGDGMQPLYNYGDPYSIFYCAYQNGSIDMTRDGGISYHSITDTIHASGGWVTPYILHPTDTATLILGYKRVYASYNNGISWVGISPEFNSNAYINRVEVSHHNPDFIYAVYNDYGIYKSVIKYTTNFGIAWDTITIPFSNFISDLAIDPNDENHIWVTCSGYGSAKVYGYERLTHTWTNESFGLPNLPVNCMAVDTSSGTRYIGTDAAVFYKTAGATTPWQLYNTNLPAVHVTDLNINYNSYELWAATFGRGMWKSLKVDRPSAVPTVTAISGESISVAPNPAYESFTVFAKSATLWGKKVTIRIVSTNGVTIMQNEATFDNTGRIKVDASAIPSGFYICEINDGASVARVKVILNK